jgi:SSS family solute:Na+ symporter
VRNNAVLGGAGQVLAGLLLAAAALPAQEPATAPGPLEWSAEADLPAANGRGGPFVGRLGEALLVAGGADFPDAAPWEGGAKVWHDELWLLDAPGAPWRLAGRLPAPLAYGAAVTVGEELWLLGGCDAAGATDAVLRLARAADGTVRTEAGPALPRPSAFHGAALAAGRIWLLAGSTDAAGTGGLSPAFWSLDPAAPAEGWREEAAFPGVPRAKAAVAAQQLGDGREAVFVIGGEAAPADPARPGSGILRDTWAFVPGAAADAGWRRLRDVPRPVAAAAVARLGPSHLLLLAGDDGSLRGTDAAAHPGFPAAADAYHTITDTWTPAGAVPLPVVTTGAVPWDGGHVVPSGETRPGVRTAGVAVLRVRPRPAALASLDWVVLVAYLAVLVGMGAWFSRRTRGSDDYFLAGRRIPWWAAGLSIYGTQLSAITFLATPALAYATDMRYAPTWVSILLVVPLVTRVFLPRFRRLGLRTAYEYLEERFSPLVRRVGSGCFLVMQTARMGIVVYLPALALATVTGLDVRACILVTGVLATLYTVLGGMEAVIWTDVLQVFVLIGGVLLALGLAFDGAGGPDAFGDAAAALKLRVWDGGFSWTEAASWSLLLGSLILMVPPYITDQAVVQRYLSARDERAAARAAWLNGWMSLPVGVLFPALGACLWAFYRAQPGGLTLGMPNDGILPLFLGDHLPAGFAGLILAGLLAATMSTLDSSMHSIATAVVNDFYRPRHPEADDARVLRVARRWTVAAGLFGTLSAAALASFEITSLFLLFLKALGLLSSGLATLFLLGVFTRVGPRAALLGAAAGTGLLGALAWTTGLHAFWFGAVGIGAGLTVGVLVGRLGRRPA